MSAEQVQARSLDVFQEFDEVAGDKAIVCLGSVKSNPTVELVLGSAFGCDPFVSQDNVAKATDRSLPFFLRYRDRDPHPPACSAGLQLSKSQKVSEAGLYYEKADGTWTFAGGATEGKDAALVFYIFRESLGRLDMVLSGFSGRATRLLARTLAHRAEDFWPPVYHQNYLQVGAFIVTYEPSESVDDSSDILSTDLMANANVIPLPAEAIARRLGRVST
jgi:hypothetical protein